MGKPNGVTLLLFFLYIWCRAAASDQRGRDHDLLRIAPFRSVCRRRGALHDQMHGSRRHKVQMRADAGQRRLDHG